MTRAASHLRLLKRVRPRRHRPPRATVSLTFDDGVASQRTAAALLEQRALTASFYIPSGLIGSGPERLGWNDVGMLASSGHEIGGHTWTHVHLPDVTDAIAQHQIVADRKELFAHGVEPQTFAYPYGEYDERAQALVRGAGYTAARAVGGVLETVPPVDRYALRTPHSARTWTNAEDLAALVRVAEHEGLWVILVFHHVENGGTSTYATSPSDLADFLDWLLTRNVVIRRVCDVITSRDTASPSRWRLRPCF